MNTLTDVNNSVLAYRHSSFDILDTSQTQIQEQNALRKQIDIDIRRVNEDYDRLFNLYIIVSNYLKSSLIRTKS